MGSKGGSACLNWHGSSWSCSIKPRTILIGEPVKLGLIGEHPSLEDLIDGDLQHHTDFRQVYATVLDQMA